MNPIPIVEIRKIPGFEHYYIDINGEVYSALISHNKYCKKYDHNNPNWKLTDREVEEIRKEKNLNHSELALKYSVSRRQIRRIINKTSRNKASERGWTSSL